jgi:hypothetical protein
MKRSVPVSALTAALAALTLSACSGAAGSPTPPAADAATRVATTRPAPSPGGFRPIPKVNPDRLAPGRLGMTANGRPDAPWAVLDVPKGFSAMEGWVIFDENPGNGGGISYWTISEVVLDPCGDPQPMKVANTVEDVVAKFQKQRLTRVTAPVPVTVDGHRGLSLELHVPAGTDFAACPKFNLWESDPAGARYLQSNGAFDRLWILDVDGDVVVLSLVADDETSKASIDRLTTMVEAVKLVPRA